MFVILNVAKFGTNFASALTSWLGFRCNFDASIPVFPRTPSVVTRVPYCSSVIVAPFHLPPRSRAAISVNMQSFRLSFSALLLILAACDDRPDQWDAYIYHDVDNIAVVEMIRGFKSFQLCQQAATDRLKSVPGNGDYECGYKCGRKEEYGEVICKETRK